MSDSPHALSLSVRPGAIDCSFALLRPCLVPVVAHMFLVIFFVSLLSAAASLRPAQCSASQMSFKHTRSIRWLSAVP